MAEIDTRAAKRAFAAEELAEVLTDPPERHAAVFASVGARFHLLAYDAGLDLTDPDDAATVAAVLYAIGSTHSVLPLAFQAAAQDTIANYRKGIE